MRTVSSEQLERQRDALEGIGSSEREQARDRIAKKHGVDPEQLGNVRLNDEGRWVATVEREQKPSERPDEEFGDLPIKLGNGKRVEDYLRAGSATYDDLVKGAVDFNSYNPIMIYNRKVFEAVTPHAPDWFNNLSINPETGRPRGEEFVRGGISGAGQILNVPSVVLGLKETGEFIGYAAAETVKGQGEEFVGDVDEAVGAARTELDKALNERPGRLSGEVVGSLVGSVGAMGTAARYSGRAGRVARYAIQPSEEILSDTATAVLSRSARGQRVLNKIPGGRLDNEEIAYAIYKRSVKPRASKLSRRIRRTKNNFVHEFAHQEASKINKFVRDSGRGQLDLAGPRGRDADASNKVEADDIAEPIDERRELARQAQKQVEYETAQRYGDVVTDRVPEYEERQTFDPGPGADSNDISSWVRPLGLKSSSEPATRNGWRSHTRSEVEEWDYPYGRTVAENFRNSQRRKSVPEIDLRVADFVDVVDAVDVQIKRQRQALDQSLRGPQKRRKQATEPSVKPETESIARQPTGAEIDTPDPVEKERERLDAAGRTAVRPFETDLTTDLERELDGETTVELEPEFETEPVYEIEPEPELEPEFETEPVYEIEPEPELEPEFETEPVYEVEREIEPEPELESEFESEYERERERWPKDATDNVFDEDTGGFGVDEDVWRSSIADADDLLRDLWSDF
ncbi:hypothetical protein [Haloferax mucosum]|uniref:hypothetical protein n=1 Tax=Haloferax mucosum TaxID=403181 RepID=UPI001F4C8F43|nr:hypothetical protein [Haloferax mucosum]